MSDNTPTDVRDAIEAGLETYNIDVAGELSATQISDNRYEVKVPFTGELLLENALSNQGNLLYNKEAEITWKGVKDGELVLTVQIDN
ncbi:hypothetical protein [Natrinema sp. 74]|uniref:hypothetical protein n=1 Tax=Natrinema sp. 74 TaxID=3384159 RepID=UPI0038D3F025